ncbi:MAG TPA: DUF6438 domain-containing protein [Hymenobacter sp.]|uniref:DUF6438 domain-containing protein n=1 Tax=Hymenobacter sp. TaxID=1898978 RepID=UPI002D7FEAC0|nr:DUF6438 domain-containing protein [Hymenobacter sp.]HET9506245.1 DUF6438 domain-containing protein [Hymenobacter sp.]
MSTTQAPPKGDTGPVLVVQRTPCHGTCPTYKAAIYADGRVEYEGERFVNRIGKHTLRLPVATVNQMLAEAKRINFNNFRDQYAGDVYDLPSTIVTVQPAGQPAKKVEARQDIPEKLQAYLDYLHKQLDPLANGLEEK